MGNRIIEVKPYRGGWKVFEAPGVEPWYPGEDGKGLALSYATERARFGNCEIHVKDAAGNVTEKIGPTASEWQTKQ